MAIRELVHKKIRKKAGITSGSGNNTRPWWNSPTLASYINSEICPDHESGVIGALRTATDGAPLALGVSVGAGMGGKERALLKAGLVKKFILYEVSEKRAEAAQKIAHQEGLGDRVESRLGDVFKEETSREFDLVYWDHALHHMLDVDQAVKWSVDVLRPGGWLLVNDYIGPTRLQWTRQEVDRAREFLAQYGASIGVQPTDLKRKTILHRWRQMYRDPSEAPQSDHIEGAYRRHTGTDLRLIGGTMVHLCGGFLTPLEDQTAPIFQDLLDWDAKARDDGFSHFAFGLWQKKAGNP